MRIADQVARGAKVGMGALAAAIPAATPALAGMGQPSDWQMNFQGSATQNMDFVWRFHDLLLILITVITLFVLGLLIYAIVKFREDRNPNPSKTTHHALLEVAWTVVPILILATIAVPSFRLLKYQLEIPPADLVVKVTGHSWYWSYEYPPQQQDGAALNFASYMLDEEQRAKAIADGRPAAETPRLLAVDNEMVVPVGKVVKLQITAADVIHNFALPSFGLRMDAIPGRLNETWFRAEREGLFYGQCSRLCGQNHAFMPIAIRVVSEAQYAAWLEDARKRFAASPVDRPVAVAGVR